MRALLIIGALFMTLSGSAQVFKSGLMAGISGSQVEGDGYGGYKKMGFIVGGFANTDLSEKMTLQFEVYFINKGSFDPARPSKGDVDMFKLNTNYVEVPLALFYHYDRWDFEGGFYLAKFLSYSLEDEFGPRDINQFPIKSFDFGGFLGIGYHIHERLILNIRSKNSLVPFRDFQNFDQNIGLLNKLFNNGWYHVDINFSLRYQFGE